MLKRIVRDCGSSAAQQDGREAHDLVPTPAQMLAVATPVDEAGATPGAGG